MPTRETDSEWDCVGCRMFCQIFEALDHIHNLLLITLIQCIDETSKQAVAKGRNSIAKQFLKNI
jgi:hypothetical protein